LPVTDPLRRPPESAWHYLVIRMAESGHDASRFVLDVWLAAEDGRWQRMHSSDDPESLDAVRAVLDEQLNTMAVDGLVDVEHLSIEFIVPRSLLDLDVDQWLVETAGGPDVVGQRFPVVMRDLFRMRNRTVRQQWHRRSRMLGERGGVALEAVRFAHLEPDDAAALGQPLHDQDHTAGVVVLGSSPDSVRKNLAVWLNFGIPVIVWCRDRRASAQFDDEVPQALNAGGALSPALVMRLRQEAESTGTLRGADVAQHIALLWDDEGRLPPDEGVRLRPPSGR
jgi:hypothetical protein